MAGKAKKLTPEQIAWLKENYAKTSDNRCRNVLGITFKRLWALADEFGLVKDKPTDFEILRQEQIKPRNKTLHLEDTSQGYCLDCEKYIKGGICGKSGKWVGALWQKKCFIGEV